MPIKKLFVVLLLALALCSCSKKERINGVIISKLHKPAHAEYDPATPKGPMLLFVETRYYLVLRNDKFGDLEVLVNKDTWDNSESGNYFELEED